MKRDGHCESLWQGGIDEFKPTGQIANNVVDIVVIGAGICGLTTALQLQRAGKSVIVLEAQNIGFGSTGGTTAHLNTIMDTPYYDIESKFGKENAQHIHNAAVSAIDHIKHNIEQYKIDCKFKEVTAYFYAAEADQVDELEKIVKSSIEVGVNVKYADHITVPIPFHKAAAVAAQAQFDPIKYIYGLAKAFESGGGVIVCNARVTDVTGDGELAEVSYDGGKLKARHVIYATHIPPGVNILHFRAAPYRSYAIAVTLKDKKYPDGPAYDLYDPYHYFRTQEKDGKQYLIAGGEDHKTGHEENTNLCLEKLESYVRKYFDVDEVAYKWSSQFFEPNDGLPYIGHLPGNPANVYVATGFGGNGMIYGTFSAILLTNLIVNGKSDYESLLAPDRVKPVAGFANFVKESADVMKEFIGRRIGISEIKEFAELAKGEARVVKVGDQSVALYKDENGKLFAVNPGCPHIQCVVGWNAAEKSWDCPCHGSRFCYDGGMLTAPARRDLDVIDLVDAINK